MNGTTTTTRTVLSKVGAMIAQHAALLGMIYAAHMEVVATIQVVAIIMVEVVAIMAVEVAVIIMTVEADAEDTPRTVALTKKGMKMRTGLAATTTKTCAGNVGGTTGERPCLHMMHAVLAGAEICVQPPLEGLQTVRERRNAVAKISARTCLTFPVALPKRP